MRVLVTGGRGFLGGHVSEALRKAGHEAIALGRADGDLAAPGVAEGLLAEHSPDAIVHLAATVGRVVGDRDPAETIRQNAGVTAVVARACAERGLPLAHGSTIEVYEPDTVYGLSKRWSEEVALRFCPGAALLRFAWPYGPGVAAGQGRGTVPNMLDQALRRERIPVFRDTVRSWCYAGDAARAVVLILESGEGGAWDIGRDDDPRTLLELAQLACRLTGAPADLIDEVDPPARAPEPRPLELDRLHGLGWRPEVDLETGVQASLDWLASRAA